MAAKKIDFFAENKNLDEVRTPFMELEKEITVLREYFEKKIVS